MEQLSVFNVSKKVEDGFNYDNEGNFTGIDIKKFSKWWKKEQELSKVEAVNTDKVLARAKATIEETSKMIENWKSYYINNSSI